MKPVDMNGQIQSNQSIPSIMPNKVRPGLKPLNLRKMSTMTEEGSEDVEMECMSDSTMSDSDVSGCDRYAEGRESGRLLSSGSKIVASGSNDGLKRSSCSAESIRDKSKPGTSAIGSSASPAKQPGRLSRDNSVHGGGLGRGMEVCGGRYKYSSMRSLKSNAGADEHHHLHLQNAGHPPAGGWASIVFPDAQGSGMPARHASAFPDSVSIRSLASIGMGSSDGRKLTIRRVPTSPSELLNMVHPPT